MFTRAIVRTPGPDFPKGLSSSSDAAPDLELALEQHAAYCQALEKAGFLVHVLDPAPGFPDATFVEDTAVVFAEGAVITRPGAPSRTREIETIAPALAAYRNLEYIEAPGTLDGGDVLQVGKRFFVGLSERTNEEGVEQFRRITGLHGYQTIAVEVDEGLHLKSSVNSLGGAVLLLTEELSEHEAFVEFEHIITPDDETYASNTLLVNGVLLTPSGYPRTAELLAKTGLRVVTLDTSEFRKLDGGLTCLSLRF